MMENQKQLNRNPEEAGLVANSPLSWFWKMTTRKYFFILYYLALSIIVAEVFYLERQHARHMAIHGVVDVNTLLLVLIFMPYGFFYLLPPYRPSQSLPLGPELDGPIRWLSFGFYILVDVVFFWLIFWINHLIRERQLPKKLILALFLYITLSFVGCVVVISRGDFNGPFF